MRSKLFLLVFAGLCLCFATPAFAQSYAITNAKIVTVSGASIDKGTVVIRGGLIESVGASVKVPADAIVLDATGLTVYPGFIDALTTLGLPPPPPPTPRVRGAAPPATDDSSNSNYSAGLRPDDSADADIKAGESQFEANRNAGFTTALTVGRSGIFNGRSAVIDLAGDSVSAMIVKDPFAEHVTFTTLGFGTYPTSLLGTFAALRQMMYDAQRLQQIQKQYAANPKGMQRPDSDRSLEALYPVINREMPVVFNANSEREVVRALDMIKEFNLNGIIAGGREAWKLADRIKSQNVAVLLSLNFPKRTAANSPEADPDTMETLRMRAETPKGAARLAAAGVRFAFESDNARSVGDFFINAGKAVENGLSRDAAIKAMTLGSAEILGVADRTGSIEPGKIANVVVVKGDLFGKDKYVSHVFVDGKYFEQKPEAKTPPQRGNGNRPTTPAGPNISGAYSVIIDVPGQTVATTFTFTQSGAALAGTMTTELGTSNITNGKVTADGFSFDASVPFGGTNIDISVHGTVAGNNISGTVDSPQGSVPFSGTKNP